MQRSALALSCHTYPVFETVFRWLRLRDAGKCRYGWDLQVREQGWGGEAGRSESYPSRGQSLAVRVRAHGQGTVEPHTSICSTVSALEEEEREILSMFSSFYRQFIVVNTWTKPFKRYPFNNITIGRSIFELNHFQSHLVSNFYFFTHSAGIIHTVVLLTVRILWVLVFYECMSSWESQHTGCHVKSHHLMVICCT